jgi:hypothetical protein
MLDRRDLLEQQLHLLAVRMSGKVWGRFGQGMFATTSGRAKVVV